MIRVEYYYLLKKYLFRLGIRNQTLSVVHWIEDLFDRHVLLRNKSLENIYEGERCFIFGTGLSVNDIDMSLLAGEYTFGSNFLNYHIEFHKLNIKFYASVSPPSVLKNVDSKATYTDSKIHSEEDIQVWLNEDHLLRYSINPKVFFKKIDSDLNNNAIVFLGASSRKYVEKHKIFRNKQVFYLKPHKAVLDADYQKIDISKRITFYESVIFFMLAIAMYMGFEEIYLIGNDYTFEPSREFHFYDSLNFSKTIEKGIVLQWINQIAKARKIKFYKMMEDEDYYKPVFVQYNQKKDAHVVVKEFAESRGVKIFNVVPDEFDSSIYKKITWKEVVNNTLKNKTKYTAVE